MATIEELAIRNALVDSYNAYAQGLDSKDWDLVRSCFAERVYIDYGEISAATGDPSTPRDIDDWMQHLVTVISKFDITRHTITNHRVVIDAGEVSCRAYMSADHVKFADPANPVATPDTTVTVVGEYNNHYENIDGSWKIRRSQLVVNWSAGNLALFA